MGFQLDLGEGFMSSVSSGNAGGSRVLLRRLRDVMVQDADTQTRLDRIVAQIGTTMVADVCSIYLRHADGSLELYATEGLSRDAVHRTRLKAGEGLVGVVAEGVEPISLADAPRHPRFSYRPETGEDPFQSFMGVPVLRGGRVVGVLVVQNRYARTYEDDEIEALQLIATVLAEIVSVEDLAGALSEFQIKPTNPETLVGKTYSRGLASGVAFLHDPDIEGTRYLSDDPIAEEARLDGALAELRQGLKALLAGEVQTLGGTSYDVLETFHLLSQDRSWERRLRDGVKNGLTAEASVEQVRSDHRARMANAKDGYLRERLHDLEELDNRLLRHIHGADHESAPENSVLVARDIGPAELLEYGRGKIVAILLEEGSPSSHAAIVAKAMGVPMIGQVPNLLARVESGDQIIVDSGDGQVYLRPDPIVANALKGKFAAQSAEQEAFAAARDTPAITLDGQNVTLLLNAGLAFDLEQLAVTGASGVGLYRTEFQFMIADSLPRLDAQIALYSEALAIADGKPVTFRTLDLGGDKVASYMPTEREENPAMGWRAVRMGLDRPGLSRYQLRALVRAAEGKLLRVMFPLVATLDEFLRARDLLEKEVSWARANGRAGPSQVKTGVMIEAPSLAWAIEGVAREADFLSIGTNDLMQFFFAADRGTAKVADRYDILSAPALGFLRHIRQGAGNTPISVCGEHAGRPLEAMAILGLGYRKLSMPAAGIGPVKRMLMSLNVDNLATEMSHMLHKGDGELRHTLTEYANAHGVVVNSSGTSVTVQ
jgi:phosphotransferase system, enzyme I, PtsP